MGSSINLDHPASFVTLSKDLETKKMIIEDLEWFVQRKEFYRRVRGLATRMLDMWSAWDWKNLA